MFEDYAQSVKDLLVVPYEFEKKVSLSTVASNGARFTTVASVADAGKSCASLTGAGVVGPLRVDWLKVSTTKKIEGKLTVPALAPNTSASFCFTDGSRAAGVDVEATGTVKYSSSDLGNWQVDVNPLTGPTVKISAIKSFSGFLVGAAGRVTAGLYGVDAKTPTIAGSMLSALVGYKAPDFTLYAQSRGETCVEALSIGLTHFASPCLTTALAATLPVAKGGDLAAIQFGGSYQLDVATTVYGAIDQDANVSLAYKQVLSKYATITLSSQVQANNFASDNHKFGLTLSLSN